MCSSEPRRPPLKPRLPRLNLQRQRPALMLLPAARCFMRRHPCRRRSTLRRQTPCPRRTRCAAPERAPGFLWAGPRWSHWGWVRKPGGRRRNPRYRRPRACPSGKRSCSPAYRPRQCCLPWRRSLRLHWRGKCRVRLQRRQTLSQPRSRLSRKNLQTRKKRWPGLPPRRQPALAVWSRRPLLPRSPRRRAFPRTLRSRFARARF